MVSPDFPDFPRAFFEVQDYRWKMKDEEYVLDERGNRIKEKVGNPRWIEVLGLEGWVEGLGACLSNT
jgi:hypothetical protein